MLRPIPSSTRAAAITPAEPVGARVARFPTAGSLPRYSGGSASALPVSRPARRSTSLRPAWSLNRPRRPFVVGVLQPMSLPPSSAPTATGWCDSCRAGFAPAEEWHLVTAHGIMRLSASSPANSYRCRSSSRLAGEQHDRGTQFRRHQVGLWQGPYESGPGHQQAPHALAATGVHGCKCSRVVTAGSSRRAPAATWPPVALPRPDG